MKKGKKIIISIVVGVLVLSGAVSSYFYYDLINKTQVAYASITIPTEQSLKSYNNEELFDYQNLVDARELAFTKLDVSSLNKIKDQFVTLHIEVYTRLTKTYIEEAVKKVESINVENDKDDEAQDFNKEKQDTLKLLAEKTFAFDDEILNVEENHERIKEEIDEMISKLEKKQKEVQQVINDRIEREKKEQEEKQSKYSNTSSSNDSSVSNSKPSGSAPESSKPSGGAPESETEKPQETCVTKPNGAVVCVTS